MDAENAARERRDPLPLPAVADARENPSSADNLPTPRVGADASAPPTGDAPPRPSTPAPAVASSSEGEAPAPLANADNGAATSEQATGDRKKRVPTIETGTDEKTVVLMRVKEELALVQVGGVTLENASEDAEKGEFMSGKDVGAKRNSACGGAASGSAGPSEVWPVGEEKESESGGEKRHQEGENTEKSEYHRDDMVKKDGRESLTNAKRENVCEEKGEEGDYGNGTSGGTGGRFAILAVEDVAENARLSGGNVRGDIA